MKSFDLRIAATVGDALDFLARYGEETEVLAGGTDLVVRMREGRTAPRRVLDISRLEALRAIEEADDADPGTMSRCVRLGALVTHAQVICSALARKLLPLLVEACQTVGAAQIRNRGTLGGNCVTASPAGDSIPALMVLEAEMVLLSTGGERRVGIADFFSGAGRTVRRRDELLAHILVPPQTADERFAYLKLGQRRALAIAVASVALRLCPGVTRPASPVRRGPLPLTAAPPPNGAAGPGPGRGGAFACGRAAVALGALAPTVIRGTRVEEALTGQVLDDATIARAAALAREAVSPISDPRAMADYRREMAGALVKRGLRELARTGAWTRPGGGERA